MQETQGAMAPRITRSKFFYRSPTKCIMPAVAVEYVRPLRKAAPRTSPGIIDAAVTTWSSSGSLRRASTCMCGQKPFHETPPTLRWLIWPQSRLSHSMRCRWDL